MVKDSDTHLYELSMQTAYTLEAQEPHVCLATGNQPGTALYGDMGRTQSSPPVSKHTLQPLSICAGK